MTSFGSFDCTCGCLENDRKISNIHSSYLGCDYWSKITEGRTFLMKAIILSRCSTDEKRQDTEVQLKVLREYCKTQDWNYDEVSYYGSASKGVPDKLQQVLDLITQRVYQIIIVHSMDRFSRLKPSVTEKMLNHIVDCNCRFISLQENLDSDNKMVWFTMKGMWLYFANMYSVNLSKKVKLGMARAKEKGIRIGRPKGSKDKKLRSKKGYYNRKRKFSLNGGLN